MIITIDGPSGVGKGTLARGLAAHYGYACLDTGLLFRALAGACLDRGCDLSDPWAIVDAMKHLDVSFDEKRLRSEAVGAVASQIGVFPEVRIALVTRIRETTAAHPKGMIVDGRDAGTVIFPEAPRKIYLTASPEERARRRIGDLRARGMAFDAEHILADIRARDDRDTHRAVSPLRPASDALIIDTSSLTAADVLARAVRFVG